MASTINDSAYYESDEHEVEISDLSKQVEASKELIIDTHIVDIVRNLSNRKFRASRRWSRNH